MKKLIIASAFIIIAGFAGAQDSLKSYHAERITTPVKIDGVMDESAWSAVEAASDLTQNLPLEGKPPTQRTEFRIVYDNSAVYIGAILYDTAPDSILHELGVRDNQDLNSDYFRFVIDPYNTQQDAYDFGVWASGVQVDSKFSDETYDAVWESATQLTSQGWCVEMKIPYSAIRFPKKDVQEWGLQLTRSIRRNREFDQWSLTPKDVPNSINYWGKLKGIKDIKSPIRLSITPFVSTYFESAPVYTEDGSNENSNSVSFVAGADLKYGIDDRFTVDLTLLPDFGQVQSDNKVKNLSYRETTYDENRPFFKEGTELFNRDNLFYSRRIGKIPGGYYNVEDNLKEGETIKENPGQVKLLNAVKLSGRTNNGLGIGIFNAITNNTYAVVEDAAGNTRRILTEPLTNYNILVFDQQLKNNSNIYFLNTNVVRDKHYNDANVSDAGFTFYNKKNTYAIDGNFAFSQIFTRIDSLKETYQNELGYKYFYGFRKTSGQFQFGLSRQVLNNTFSSSDLGYQSINNLVSNRIYADYNFYNPNKYFRESYNSISVDYQTNYLTGERTKCGIDLSLFVNLLSYNAIFGGGGITPLSSLDYYEPREDGNRYNKTIRYYYSYIGVSSDYRKKLALDLTFNMSNFIDRFVSEGYNTDVTLRWRMNDHLSIKYIFAYYFDPYNFGHANFDSAGNNIYGVRKLNTFINSLNLQYIFNKNMSLSLIGRHYWSRGEYRHYYTLQDDGDVIQNDVYDENNDFSYNVFNIDLLYSWRFAPGSDIVLAFKNAIENEDQELISHFGKNLDHTLKSPQTNSISLKIIYYFDYLYLRKK
jgi:hypothetical protein